MNTTEKRRAEFELDKAYGDASLVLGKRLNAVEHEVRDEPLPAAVQKTVDRIRKDIEALEGRGWKFEKGYNRTFREFEVKQDAKLTPRYEAAKKRHGREHDKIEAAHKALVRKVWSGELSFADVYTECDRLRALAVEE